MISAFRVSNSLDPAHADVGRVHLTRSAAEAHVASIARFCNEHVFLPVIEAVEVDSVPDQRVTIHGWHVGFQFNRRSMGRRTLRSAPVTALRLLADRIVGVVHYDLDLPAVPVVWVTGEQWSSYSLGDAGEIITTEA